MQKYFLQLLAIKPIQSYSVQFSHPFSITYNWFHTELRKYSHLSVTGGKRASWELHSPFKTNQFYTWITHKTIH